jgi:arylsulfatase A-like enzyme
MTDQPVTARRCALALLVFTVAFGRPAHAQEASSNRPERPSQAERPNILLAISDDQSWPHASAYGTPWVDTPAFDRVARNGLLFNRAYTPNAKCAPSRATILTGRNSWQLGAAANHWAYWPERFASYVEALSSEGGYFAGHTGKEWAPGVAEKENGDRRYLAGRPFEDRTLDEPPTEAIDANDYAGNFRAFLEAKPSGEPFVFWYGGREPHRGYDYGSGLRQGGKERGDIDRVPPMWPDTDSVRTDMLDYAFEIEHFDDHLGRMLDALEARGELENTLVVVTSDNGMPFPRIKGQEYDRSNHLPLAIMWGDGIENPGRVIEDHVSFIDFAPTFLEVAGVEREETQMQPVTGQSLTGLFRSEEAGQVTEGRDHVLIGKEVHDVGRPGDVGYPIRGLVTDDYLYLRNFKTGRWPAGPPETGYLNTDGSPTKTVVLETRRVGGTLRYWRPAFGKRPPHGLYRIASDPASMNNLADDAAYEDLMNRMRKQLFSELEAQDDPRVLGRGDVFEEYPYANERTRNFYERFMEGELGPPDAGWVNPSDFEPNFPDSLRQAPAQPQ